MQKFTRAITREIELAGERLALTLDAEGVSVRPVGSRKPPHTCSWASILRLLADQGEGAVSPTAEELAATVARLRGGKANAPASSKSADSSASGSSSSKEGSSNPTALPVLARLEKWLAAHRPRFLRNLRSGASAAELDKLSSALGRALPTDLWDLLAWHNGQGDDFAGCLERSWLLMSATEILAAKNDLDQSAKEEPATGWRAEWVPFLEDDAGNFVCVDAGPSEAPVREYWAGNAEHPVVAASLRAWLEEIVAAMERGEYVEDPERGRFLRR